MKYTRVFNKKVLLPLFCMMVLILVHSCTVLAAEKENIGSIKIELTEGAIGTSKENVVFEYQKVADLRGGYYYLLEEYDKLDIDLNELEYADQLDEAARELSKHITAEGQAVTDEDGEAFITDLEIGVYLLKVSDKARYEEVTPVLIAIPTWNEEAGDMDYHLTVIPKHSPNQPGTIITDTPSIPGEGVNTGDDNNVIAACVLTVVSGFMILMISKKRKEKLEV